MKNSILVQCLGLIVFVLLGALCIIGGIDYITIHRGLHPVLSFTGFMVCAGCGSWHLANLVDIYQEYVDLRYLKQQGHFYLD